MGLGPQRELLVIRLVNRDVLGTATHSAPPSGDTVNMVELTV